MNMENKVDLLISTIRNLIECSERLGIYNLSRPLNTACFCLKSNDLGGLGIILTSIEEITSQDIKDKNFQEIINHVQTLAKDIQNDFDKDIVPLSSSEELFLNLSYNKFLDIYTEINLHQFWENSPQFRFCKISQAFTIYSEILNHEPFKGVLLWLSKYRPPMEAEISGPLFKFIRNVLSHFPFFDTWDEIWINKSLVNWRKSNQSIDRFLVKLTGKPEIKYRFKEKSKSEFTYITINFPKVYGEEKIYLKDMIKEEEGIKFALIMMMRVLNTQIESINE